MMIVEDYQTKTQGVSLQESIDEVQVTHCPPLTVAMNPIQSQSWHQTGEDFPGGSMLEGVTRPVSAAQHSPLELNLKYQGGYGTASLQSRRQTPFQAMPPCTLHFLALTETWVTPENTATLTHCCSFKCLLIFTLNDKQVDYHHLLSDFAQLYQQPNLPSTCQRSTPLPPAPGNYFSCSLLSSPLLPLLLPPSLLMTLQLTLPRK